MEIANIYWNAFWHWWVLNWQLFLVTLVPSCPWRTASSGAQWWGMCSFQQTTATHSCCRTQHGKRQRKTNSDNRGCPDYPLVHSPEGSECSTDTEKLLVRFMGRWLTYEKLRENFLFGDIKPTSPEQLWTLICGPGTASETAVYKKCSFHEGKKLILYLISVWHIQGTRWKNCQIITLKGAQTDTDWLKAVIGSFGAHIPDFCHTEHSALLLH